GEGLGPCVRGQRLRLSRGARQARLRCGGRLRDLLAVIPVQISLFQLGLQASDLGVALFQFGHQTTEAQFQAVQALLEFHINRYGDGSSILNRSPATLSDAGAAAGALGAGSATAVATRARYSREPAGSVST